MNPCGNVTGFDLRYFFASTESRKNGAYPAVQWAHPNVGSPPIMRRVMACLVPQIAIRILSRWANRTAGNRRVSSAGMTAYTCMDVSV